MKRKFLFNALAVLCAAAAVISADAVHTAAADTGTTTLVWFSGVPSKSDDGKYPSLNEAAHDGNITYTTYDLKGKGRFQWGEKDADGTWKVYYDANDLKILTEELNRQTEKFNEVYETYRQLINATN